MPKAIANAKMQSVGEIKRKAKLKKWYKITTYFFVILLSLIILFMLFNHFFLIIKEQPKIYSLTEAGILFESKNIPVSDAISVMSLNQNFNQIINLSLDDINNMHEYMSIVTAMQSILIGGGKNVILILNYYDDTLSENKTLLSCSSNLGDVYTYEELNAEECLNLMNNGNYNIIINAYNNNYDNKIFIDVDENTTTITGKDINNINLANYILLRGMFPNYESINESINNIINQIK